MENQNQPIQINLSTINRETFFAQLLIEKNQQLAAAIIEIQNLRQACQQIQEELALLKERQGADRLPQ